VRLAVTAGYVLRLGLLPHDAGSPHVPGPPHRFFDKLNSSFNRDGVGRRTRRTPRRRKYVFHHVPGSFEGTRSRDGFEDRGWPGASLGTAVAVAEDIGLCCCSTTRGTTKSSGWCRCSRLAAPRRPRPQSRLGPRFPVLGLGDDDPSARSKQ